MLKDLLEIGDGGSTTSLTIGEKIAMDVAPGHAYTCPYHGVPKKEMGRKYDPWFSPLTGSHGSKSEDNLLELLRAAEAGEQPSTAAGQGTQQISFSGKPLG